MQDQQQYHSSNLHVKKRQQPQVLLSTANVGFPADKLTVKVLLY